MDEKLVIKNLKDTPEHIETVSEWLWEQWAKSNGYTLNDIIYRTSHSMCEHRIPKMYVALYDGKPVGTAALWSNDLPVRQDLYPWLAVLYVLPEYRGQRIAEYLQNKCISSARKLGFSALYLETTLENYYERYGWEYLESVNEGKESYVKLYKYDLLKNIIDNIK